MLLKPTVTTNIVGHLLQLLMAIVRVLVEYFDNPPNYLFFFFNHRWLEIFNSYYRHRSLKNSDKIFLIIYNKILFFQLKNIYLFIFQLQNIYICKFKNNFMFYLLGYKIYILPTFTYISYK